MKFKMFVLICLVVIFTIGAVSAGENSTQDDITEDVDIIEIHISDEDSPMDEDVSSQESDDDQIISAEGEDEVLGEALVWEDIKINGNTKTIDATKAKTVIATIKLPKGKTAYLDLSADNIPGLEIKLSKLAHTTKNGVTTYKVYLKDLKDYKNVCDDLVNKGSFFINVKYYNVFEKCYGYHGFEYVIKVNKKAKTFRLKKKIDTMVWTGYYDRKSGTNKRLTVHLGRWPSEKPIAGKKVKITINGVVYNKKTNSKGLIYIYPPKYLPPKQFQKVKMEFAGDGLYRQAMTINDIQIYKNPGSSKSKIKASSKTFSVNGTKKYTVKLLSKGKALKKAKVKLVIKGKKYSAKTDSKGRATFNLSKLTKKGKFKGSVLYMGDKKHYMSYKYVKLTVK